MKTKIVKILSSDDEAIEEAGLLLRNGGLCAIPTETVYGLAANALNGACVKKIYAAKGRPSDNPLIVHISDISQWAPLVREIPEKAMKLAEKYWPGPLTIILPKSDIIPDEVSGGLSTVAVRMPSHPIARAVIEKAGVPLAAPSANTSGMPSPTDAKYVIDDMNGKIDMIIDAGKCEVGVESTVVTLVTKKPKLLRPGGITPQMLESVLGEIEIDDAVYNKLAKDEVASSPGMKYKHYSPKAKVIIINSDFEKYKSFVENNCNSKTVALCFEEDAEKLTGIKKITYGKADDSFSQAERIFDALRELDEVKAETAYARFPKLDGMGLAVFNRLIRAAAFNIIKL